MNKLNEVEVIRLLEKRVNYHVSILAEQQLILQHIRKESVYLKDIEMCMEFINYYKLILENYYDEIICFEKKLNKFKNYESNCIDSLVSMYKKRNINLHKKNTENMLCKIKDTIQIKNILYKVKDTIQEILEL